MKQTNHIINLPNAELPQTDPILSLLDTPQQQMRREARMRRDRMVYRLDQLIYGGGLISLGFIIGALFF